MKIWFIDGKIDKEDFQLCQNFFLFEELKVGDNKIGGEFCAQFSDTIVA